MGQQERFTHELQIWRDDQHLDGLAWLMKLAYVPTFSKQTQNGTITITLTQGEQGHGTHTEGKSHA